MTVLELTLERSALERAITVLLKEGARELELFDEESPPVLAVLFDAGEPQRVLERVQAALGAVDIIPAQTAARRRSQIESSERWVGRPVRFGPLWFVPPGRAIPPGAEHALILESAASGVFGSGGHATTALILERVIEMSPIESFLDVGTGSGILSLAALALGAKRVAATENDRAALELAKKNAVANGFADRLELSATLPAGQFSVIAANILAASLLELAPELVRRLASKGTILLSGVRQDEVEEVAKAYRNLGLARGPEEERGGWYRLELIASW